MTECEVYRRKKKLILLPAELHNSYDSHAFSDQSSQDSFLTLENIRNGGLYCLAMFPICNIQTIGFYSLSSEQHSYQALILRHHEGSQNID